MKQRQSELGPNSAITSVPAQPWRIWSLRRRPKQRGGRREATAYARGCRQTGWRYQYGISAAARGERDHPVAGRSGFRCRRGGSEELRAGICRSASEAAGADAVEQIEALAGDLQYPGAGMAHHLARQMKQTPADGGDFVTLPDGAQGGMLEEDEQVVGDDADAEECGVGGHTLHAKADLQFLDPVLEHRATLPIPDQGVGSRFRPVAANDIVLAQCRGEQAAGRQILRCQRSSIQPASLERPDASALPAIRIPLWSNQPNRTILGQHPPHYTDKHPMEYSPAPIASCDPGCDCTTKHEAPAVLGRGFLLP